VDLKTRYKIGILSYMIKVIKFRIKRKDLSLCLIYSQSKWKESIQKTKHAMYLKYDRKDTIP
jgi:hypothetical protein